MTPRFYGIGIVTADLAASLTFYRRLGVDIPEGAEESPHVEAELAGGHRILWDVEDTVRSFDPGWTPDDKASGRVALAFACDTPAGVDRQYADLTGAGYHGHKEPWDAFWGQRYALVHDPDGNTVELFAPLP